MGRCDGTLRLDSVNFEWPFSALEKEVKEGREDCRASRLASADLPGPERG